VVYLLGGTYQLTNSFQLSENATNHDSGTGGHNVIYQNAPGQTPVISGGMVVTNWALYNPATNIWRAYVGTGVNSRQLYVNGVRAIRARSAINPSGFLLDTTTGLGFWTTNTAMQNWRNLTNIEIATRQNWKMLRCPIASITGTNIVMQQPGWSVIGTTPNPGHPWNGAGSVSMKSVSWVENVYELMASSGMWYLDQASGWLYYIPRPGENLTNGAVVVLPVLEKLIDAQGAAWATPLHNVVLSGLTFQYATWLLPSTSIGYADNQTSVMWSGAGLPPVKTLGNVSFQTAANIQITNCVFSHLGGSALDFGGGAHNNLIMGNRVDDISATGITVGEVADYATTDTNQMTDGNMVVNNYIRRVGQEYEDAIGIWFGYSRNTLIAHNDIDNTPYSGISLGWGWATPSYSSNNQVVGNFVGKVMQVLSDGGSCYTLSAQTNSWMIANYFKDSGHQGIYWDEGTSYYTAISNVLDNVSVNFINFHIVSGTGDVATNNFANGTRFNPAPPNGIVTNTVIVTNQFWTPAAQQIIVNAGIEPAFARIKSAEWFVDDTEPAFDIVPSDWSVGGNAGEYHGKIHYTKTDNQAVQYTFTASGIAWIGDMNVDESNVDVYLDGTFQQTVNCWSSTRVTQAWLFSANNLAAGPHTLKLVKKGGTYMVLDAFAVTPTNFWLTATPNSGSASAGVAFSNVIKLDTFGGYSGTTTLSLSGLPAGATASFNPPSITGAGFTTLTVTVATNTLPVTTNLTIIGTGGGATNLVTVALTVSAASPPVITVQPASQIDLTGTSATFTVTATGTGLGFQWFKNGVALSDGGNVSGSATSMLGLSGVTTNDVASYSVVVTNVLASVTSSNATLTVMDPPVITGQPASRTNNLGTLATFSVTATGTGLGYHWFKNGAPLADGGNVSGSAAATLSLSNVSAGDGAGYDVVVSDAVGSVTSAVVTLTINGPPITPANLVAVSGNAMVGLSWSAAAGATSYNVKRALINGGPYTPIANVSTLNFTDTGLTNAMVYYYVVSATNAYGESANSAPVNVVPGWSRYTLPISFINYAFSGTLTNFPLLVVLGTNLADFSYNQFAATNGGDLRFADGNGNELNYELEKWNPSGASYVWVQMPLLNSNSMLQASWGNAALTNPPSYTTNGAAWNSNYVGVWHLGQTPPAVAQDSTANTNRATPSAAMGATNQVPGNLDGSLDFDGVADYLNVPSTPALGLTNGPFTLSAWINLNAADDGVIIGKGQNGVIYYSWFLTVGNNPGVDNGNTSNRLCVGFRTSSGSADTYVTQTNNVTLSNWMHVAGTYDGAKLTLYVNGQVNATKAASGLCFSNSTQLWIGADSGRDYLNGRIDELRVENVARPANWVWAAYGNTASNNWFNTYGTVGPAPLAPAITAQPASRTNSAGTVASFTVAANGTPAGCQWLKNGTNLTDGGNVSGSQTATLTLSNVLIADAGNYSVVVSNSAGSVTSQAAVLTVNKAMPSAVLAVTNTPMPYDGNAHAATVVVVSSSVPGTVANLQTGGAPSQTTVGTYAVTADFVPNDTADYYPLPSLSAGNFSITPAMKPRPVIAATLRNGVFTISGSNNSLAGLTNYLLASTNLALPAASWTPVATNVFDTNGNLSIPNLNPTNPQIFYQIQVP